MKWFKMESGIYENAKVQSLDLPVLKTWLNLLGVYARYEGFPSIKQVAYITRQNADELSTHIEILIKDELLDRGADGTLTPHDWEDYNPYELSTERVRKHRAMKQVKQITETDGTNETCFIVPNVPPVSVPPVENPEKHGNMKHMKHVSSQVVENKTTSNGAVPLDDLSETMKQMKRLRVEESRREEIREEKNSHPYPLSEIAVRLPDEKNGASAILKSSQNGKAHEPSEPELDAFSIWAHAVYQRHPKQKNLHDTLWTLKQKFANRPDDQKLLDENHPLWIAYWQLDPSYPRFVPGLADRDGRGWLNDQVWRKPPPPPPVADTKHARAKAWADKFKGETQ